MLFRSAASASCHLSALMQKDVMSEADARYFLGRVLLDKNRVRDGRAQLELAIKADPNHGAARAVLDELSEARNAPAIIPAAVK